MMLEASGPVQLHTSPTLMGAREVLADAAPVPPTPPTTMVPTSIKPDATPVNNFTNRFTGTPFVVWADIAEGPYDRPLVCQPILPAGQRRFLTVP